MDVACQACHGSHAIIIHVDEDEDDDDEDEDNEDYGFEPYLMYSLVSACMYVHTYMYLYTIIQDPKLPSKGSAEWAVAS